MNYENFAVSVEAHIASVTFNRPEKANALNRKGWEELQLIFETLNQQEDVRVVILSGEGKHFCAGIDLELLMSVQHVQTMSCEGRKREEIRKFIKQLQAPVNAIEQCNVPVLACIHNGCIGGGLDIAAACDIGFCTEDSYFTIKELDMGMVADLGSLQRLPKIVPYAFVAEMAYTGRKVSGVEAKSRSLVNETYKDKNEMMKAVWELAGVIASKSPIAVRGTKEMLQYSRDHNVDDALNHMSVWNPAFFLSEDLMEAFSSTVERRKPMFKN